ncbi:MAG: aspartate carbamoyltransferase catalytic subunit [Saccharofermentanales bacterium]|jgi:aspartate carbamoyltransferase catalytic subunit|nr:aspartate carbamoyltransferase catalytic subunit [Clostridiaceae bacterium]
MQLIHKDLLGIQQLTVDEINLILDTAETMKMVLQANSKRTAHLQGKSIVTLFYENSTRTRLSFEMASKFMSAASANIATSGSSVNKGESLVDTARTIDMMSTDILIMRHGQSGAPHLIAPRVKASVINAGDGMNEHPTQALLDFFTMRQKKGGFEGLRVAIIGDVLHSRVARSNLWGLIKLGAEVRLAAPPTMMPLGLAEMGAVVCPSVRDAVQGADVVMALRIQLERMRAAMFPSISEYARFFALDDDALRSARPDAIIMHPGPCNHGVEMPTHIYESSQSVINEQVTNGVAVRMAIMYLLQARRNVG